ncbi:MAG: hypothetical protein AB7I12_08500 [Steroidobacteraceae bacterium]
MHDKQLPSNDLIDAPDLTGSVRSGRAAWDERGNSVWEWQTAPGVFTREISSQQLEALEATDLRIVDLEQVSVRPVTGCLHTGQPGMAARKRNKVADKSKFEKFLMRLGLPA